MAKTFLADQVLPDGRNLTTALAGKLDKSTFDANTVLKADTDDTPTALTMAASTILARLASGSIKAATPSEIITLLALTLADLTDVDLSGAVANDLFGYDGSTWGPVSPPGGEILDEAINDTGTVTGVERLSGAGAGTTWVDIPSCAITAPVDSRPQSLYMQAGGTIATYAASQLAWIRILETTGGGSTEVLKSPYVFVGTTGLPVTPPVGFLPLGVVTSARTFKLQAGMQTVAVVSAKWNVANSATSPSLIRTIAG